MVQTRALSSEEPLTSPQARTSPPTGQFGRADKASVRAEFGENDRGVRPVGGPRQSVLERCRGGPKKQVASVGHAAAENEAAGVQDRRQVRKALAEPAPNRAKTPQRRRVALAGR